MLVKLHPLDVAIIFTYFLVVLAIGFGLKERMKTSSDFLLSGKSFSHWITGIAFMSANLGDGVEGCNVARRSHLRHLIRRTAIKISLIFITWR